MSVIAAKDHKDHVQVDEKVASSSTSGSSQSPMSEIYIDPKAEARLVRKLDLWYVIDIHSSLTTISG